MALAVEGALLLNGKWSGKPKTQHSFVSQVAMVTELADLIDTVSLNLKSGEASLIVLKEVDGLRVDL